ncbi:DUF2584 domain-containing protein [Bacillus testis]|uniref:DUF2584 domain-containing protein n=1 Tax=Bacillus testis TaxID=1622072 RepID=UPI00067ECF5B|nr:DUF2584 domain-containing protein [Bacillus testis]
MGMPMEVNTMIVTKGKEERIGKNDFSLVKSGYRLYPIDIPVSVRKTKNSEDIGTAYIKKVSWEKNETHIVYELTSLHSVN